MSQTQYELPPKEVRDEGSFCHLVHNLGDLTVICGISREEATKDCPYEDYDGYSCKCGKRVCPECLSG